MPRDEASRYAGVLQKVAAEHQFDPLTAIAIIQHESHWISSAVSPDGEDLGLGQVRARYIGACRDDADPVHAPSEACRAVKARLLSPHENIRTMGKIIAANREFCAKRGLLKTENWLAGYQGYGSPARNEFCKPGPLTKDVLDMQAELLAKVAPKKVDKKADAKKLDPKKRGGAAHDAEPKKPSPPVAPGKKEKQGEKKAERKAPAKPGAPQAAPRKVPAAKAAPGKVASAKRPLSKGKPVAIARKAAPKKR